MVFLDFCSHNDSFNPNYMGSAMSILLSSFPRILIMIHLFVLLHLFSDTVVSLFSSIIAFFKYNFIIQKINTNETHETVNRKGNEVPRPKKKEDEYVTELYNPILCLFSSHFYDYMKDVA